MRLALRPAVAALLSFLMIPAAVAATLPVRLARPSARRRRAPRAAAPRAAVLGLGLALSLLPAAAAAHESVPLEPHDLWRAWTLDPWVLGGIALAAWLYARGVRRVWGRAGAGRGVRRWQAACFAAGAGALIVALVSPLDALGGALFSAHMLQHVILMLVAAPLLVLGAPVVAFLWALPPAWRRRVGGWARRPDVRGAWFVVGHPVSAWLLHAAAVWTWHAPGLYQATLHSRGLHALQHLSFFGTALLFWWAAVELGRHRRRRAGFGVLYIFTTAVHSSLLGALLTFSLVLWYPAYAASAPSWGLAPLEDQQLGGLVMWIPGGVVYVAAALALLAVLLLGGNASTVRAAPWIATATGAERG